MHPGPLSSCSSTIRLPNTCPSNKRSFPHIRLLTSVSANGPSGMGFEGPFYKVGARVPAADLGENPILLEHAGPQGLFKRGNAFQRENLYILWRYDWAAKDWREIARALSLDWGWALTLREPAIRALHPQARDVVDFAERGREVTAEVLRAIDSALSVELPEVRMAALTSIYDQVAGRIVAA